MSHGALAFVLLCAGCAADATNGHDAGPDASAPVPTEQPAPVASAPSPPASAPAPSTSASAAAASGGTCLMFYHCACNVGCSKVATARDQLRDGLEVDIVSGINAGSRVFVAASKDKAGKEVFSLTHYPPGRVMPCALPAARSLMAYPCHANKTGALDAHACDSACE